MHVELPRDAVDRAGNHRAASTGLSRAAFINRSGVAGIARTSKPAWRRALTTAGAGPSIGISPTPLAPYGPCLYGRSRMTVSIGGVSGGVGMM